MKRLLALLISLLVLAGACGGAVAEEKLTVVATTYPLYDLAASVGGELVDVVYASENAAEAAAEADIVLCVGGEADAWTAGLEGKTVVKAAEGLLMIEGDLDVTTIPVNCMIVASYLADALAVVDGDNNAVYQENLGNYIMAMSELDLAIRAVVTADTVVSCADGSMAYFAQEYGVTYSQDAEGAIVLSTYNVPAEEDMELSYAELMQKNIAALSGETAE